MKKTLLFLLLFILSLTELYAQYNRPENRVWIMGRRIGLNFNTSGDPVPITSQMTGLNDEGCASICDENGALLFYTNGYKAWTANHTVMPHGQNISGFSDIVASASQGTLIVPFSREDKKYLLFTVLQYTAPRCKLYCNLVNMNLNGGLGDIDTTFSLYGTVFADSLAEKIIAIQGCNNNIWVLVHHTSESIFKAFEVTAAGVSTTPVVSVTSNQPSDFFFGVMKGSPRRDRIITAQETALKLYRFDALNGTVYDQQTLDNANYYGISFSPNGSKVYAKSAIGPYDTLFQFDLNAANPVSSKTYVGNVRTWWIDLKLGPDGKLYMASKKGITPAGAHYMARVNYPDNAGAACGFQDSVSSTYFYNPADTLACLQIGLPNDVVFPAYFVSDSSRLTDTVVCPFPTNGVTLYADTQFGHRTWNNGDTTATLTVQQGGTYWVSYNTRQCYTRTDTFRIRGNMIPVQIVYNNTQLSTAQTYATYQWYKAGAIIPGATGQFCTPTGNGWYSVKVANALGCSDSAAYELTQVGIHEAPDLAKQIRIYPNPAAEKIYIESPVPVNVSLLDITGKRLLRVARAAAVDVSNCSDGIYLLRIDDSNNHPIKTEKVLIRHKH